MMESYLLKASLSMAILYLVYRLITHYESNHQLNRFLGLAFLVFSASVLFIPIEGLFEQYETNEPFYVFMKEASDIQSGFARINSGDSIPIYHIIYVIGVCFFSIRSVIGLTTLIYHYFNSVKYHRWGFTVIALEKDVSPFTFFNILFIGNQRLKDEYRDVVLVHEQFHRDQFHSLDALMLEVLTIVFWFNPFIWLFQRDIKAEHEYLADSQVLKKGISKLDYQQLLFKVRAGVFIQLGNYLSNKTSLSKRFNKMTNQKTNLKMSYTRVGASLIIMAVIMFISACSTIDKDIQADVQAVYEQGMPALYKTIGDNLNYPKSARDENSEGLIYVSFTVNTKGEVEDISTEKRDGYMLEAVVVNGYLAEEAAKNATKKSTDVNEAIKAEVIRTTKLLGKFTPAQKEGKPINSVLILPIKFQLIQ